MAMRESEARDVLALAMDAAWEENKDGGFLVWRLFGQLEEVREYVDGAMSDAIACVRRAGYRGK